MPFRRIISLASSAYYGRAYALGLDRDDADDLFDLYRPRPRGDTGAYSHDRQRDPFQDPGEPLRLTLASDTRWLPRATYDQLLTLGFFPGVELHLVPGLATVTSTGKRPPVCHVARSGEDRWSAVKSCRPNSWTAMHPAGQQLLDMAAAMFPQLGPRSQRLLVDLFLHEATGGDFLVSDGLASAIRPTSPTWLRNAGVCTGAEAMRLAGTKARMFSKSPVHFGRSVTTYMNVGLWQDRALQHFAPHLNRAIIGAHSPAASGWEERVRDHLLAIRSGFRDLLIARDAVYRLIRSDGIRDRAGESPFGDTTVGVRGNDLLQQLGYHTVAALNVAYSVGDNLGWTMLYEAGLERKRSVGLRRILYPRRDYAPDADLIASPTLARHRSRLTRRRDVGIVLALQSVRNRWVHQDWVQHGRVTVGRKASGHHDFFAVWLQRADYKKWDWTELEALADLTREDIAVMSFDRLLDGLWTYTLASVDAYVMSVAWSSVDWIKTDPDWRVNSGLGRGWDRELHRLLWGVGAT